MIEQRSKDDWGQGYGGSKGEVYKGPSSFEVSAKPGKPLSSFPSHHLATNTCAMCAINTCVMCAMRAYAVCVHAFFGMARRLIFLFSPALSSTRQEYLKKRAAEAGGQVKDAAGNDITSYKPTYGPVHALLLMSSQAVPKPHCRPCCES